MTELFDFDSPEFFAVFREATERAFASHKALRRAGVSVAAWQRRARWRPFREDEIAAAEAEWGAPFPPDYREYLRLLGAPHRATWLARVLGDFLRAIEPGFYDWRSAWDREEIENAGGWLSSGIVFDVEQAGLWMPSWGPRPATAELRASRVEELVASAPTLLPIIGHRYLLADPCKSGNPVLSVHQSDIIVYGANLRRYLVHELSSLLGLDRELTWRHSQSGCCDVSTIPFWGELILADW